MTSIVESGPYVLRPLLSNVPLAADGEINDVRITCIDFWDGNLYVGTSAAEVLHFVSLPPEPQDTSQSPQFILASRLQPTASTDVADWGVRQIQLLPSVGKACILCNGVLTFHSLPELSPSPHFVSYTSWIGGKDLDAGEDLDRDSNVVMVAVKKPAKNQDVIRVLRIPEEGKPNLVKNIEFRGCIAGKRRGRFACLADAQGYSLIDVENKQKAPLFPTSSNAPLVQEPSTTSERPTSISPSSRTPVLNRLGVGRRDGGHHRKTSSLGVSNAGPRGRAPSSSTHDQDWPTVRTPDQGLPSSSATSPVRSGSGVGSPTPSADNSMKPLPEPPEEQSSRRSSPIKESQLPPKPLDPHICSLPNEFLLTTGTAPDEAGMGMFVNFDGDVVRGTVEFRGYPHSIVVDCGVKSEASAQFERIEIDEGYVIAAVVSKSENDSYEAGLEIQRWDEAGADRSWLRLAAAPSLPSENLPESLPQRYTGVINTTTANEIYFSEVGDRLRSQRLQLISSPDGDWNGGKPGRQSTLDLQGDEFIRRLGRATSSITVWNGQDIYWLVRNPMLLRFDAMVDAALKKSSDEGLESSVLMRMMDSLSRREATTEAEFLSIEHLRQKISLILFYDIATKRYAVAPPTNERLFVESDLDPRIVLSLIPLFKNDIVEGERGMLIHAGLVKLIEDRRYTGSISLETDDILSRPEEFDVLSFVKRYLNAWRQRKGLGSIADEEQVFESVDAAYLHVLLYQDQNSHEGPGRSPSTRTELYAVVDHGVSCFNRAVELLESFHRLYVLSRLYQSRRMSRKVLETWQRIMEGESDAGAGLTDGEMEVRNYLPRLRDPQLVEQYATWLARRNPSLGVQVFTDESSRIKLPPNEVVQLLQKEAPDSVQVYLEHLVFEKKSVRYANNLITYYLNHVLSVLDSSPEARSTLAQSYETYRALDAPKPTYREFITDNTIAESWWHDRLRLLELIGGSHGVGFEYDVDTILERVEPFEDALVPETIILNGRQGRHEQALRLLTHGLGDYHTAINYCLLGGSSMFHPVSGGVADGSRPSKEEQSTLFSHLLLEFLVIEDEQDREERTSELLGRFGAWFDVADVLRRVPGEWPVELLEDFLTGAIRRIVTEKNEAMVIKALSAADNLKVAAAFIEKVESVGPMFQLEQEQVA